MGHLPPERSSAELAQLVAGIAGIYHPESQEEYFIATLLDAVDTPHDPPALPTPPTQSRHLMTFRPSLALLV
jgi:hypothetical protein